MANRLREMEACMTPVRVALTAGALVSVTAAAIVAVNLPSIQSLISDAVAATQLSDAELKSQLQAEGYTNLQEIQHKGDRVYVMATKDGQTRQLVVDAVTGKQVSEDDDDDD
jgi:hypothetical protein